MSPESEKRQKKPPGRPRHSPGEVKRVPLNMRTTPSLRAELEEAAGKSGRSLAQEVESRLERTFSEDHLKERLLGPYFQQLVNLGLMWSSVEQAHQKPFTEDEKTARAVADVTVAYIAELVKLSRSHFEQNSLNVLGGSRVRKAVSQFLPSNKEFVEAATEFMNSSGEDAES
jgi:head-tail adaptor